MDKRSQQRFWKKVARGQNDECWEWQASTAKQGHGLFRVSGDVVAPAHRIAYILAGDDIPDEMEVAHHCGNPTCCNPQHLFLTTHRENMQDVRVSGRRRKHLNPHEIRQIRIEYGESTVAELATKYECSEATVAKYAHIPKPRSRKSPPFAVRLPTPLADWVREYVAETGISKTGVFEKAILLLKKSEKRRLNGRKQDILEVLQNESHGS